MTTYSALTNSRDEMIAAIISQLSGLGYVFDPKAQSFHAFLISTYNTLSGETRSPLTTSYQHALALLANYAGGTSLSRFTTSYENLLAALATNAANLLFTPASLSGLAFWHDASLASSVTLNGGDVSQINDLSGNSRHASQGTAGAQPAYTSAAINGKNVITFTGANSDALAFANATAIGQNIAGFSFAGVVRMPNFTASQRFFSLLGGTGAARFVCGCNTSGRPISTTRRLDGDANVGGASTTLQMVVNTAHFFAGVVDYTAGTVTYYLDGSNQQIAQAWSGGNGNTSNTASNSAPNYGASGVLLTGDIAEGVGYPRALSGSEIDQLRTSYFKSKWGTA